MDRLVELLQPTAGVLDVWCQLLRVVSSCESRASGHTAENGHGVVRVPPIHLCRAKFLLGKQSCPPGYSFPLAGQRVASRLASPCLGLPAPLEMEPRTELLGQRAADVCVSGCPRSYRGLQKVEICRPDTGHLRHQ